MKWSKRAPKAVGWYWWRKSEQDQSPDVVWINKSTLQDTSVGLKCFFCLNIGMNERPRDNKGQWLKIPLPPK